MTVWNNEITTNQRLFEPNSDKYNPYDILVMQNYSLYINFNQYKTNESYSAKMNQMEMCNKNNKITNDYRLIDSSCTRFFIRSIYCWIYYKRSTKKPFNLMILRFLIHFFLASWLVRNLATIKWFKLNRPLGLQSEPQMIQTRPPIMKVPKGMCWCSCWYRFWKKIREIRVRIFLKVIWKQTP